MTRPDLRTYRYQKLRAAFLAEITHCHWCHRPAPRLTIDHVLPIVLHPGLDPLDVGNWVAACLPCNAKRGAMISNAGSVPRSDTNDRRGTGDRPRFFPRGSS